MSIMDAPDFDPIILEPERLALTRVSRPTWSRLEKAGDTPARIQLSPRRHGYRRSEILRWLDERRVDRERASV